MTDDASTPVAWTTLLEPHHAAWLADVDRAVAAGGPNPSEITRWRRHASAALVARAIELVRARRSLTGRIPEAAHLLADRAGAAMATDAATGAWKADRLRAAGADAAPREIWDLACGIGGDALHLARIPSLERLVLVDADADRVAMAAHNVRLVAPQLEVVTHVGDAAVLAPEAAPGCVVHVDPARRDDAGRRSHRLEDLRPTPDELTRIIDRSGAVVLKLGPGVDPAEIPRSSAASVEYVAVGRAMVQAVAWYGALADPAGSRRATMLPAGTTLVGPPDASMDPAAAAPAPRQSQHWCAEPPAFLLVPHPAAERARLVSAAWRTTQASGGALMSLAPGLGVLASTADPQSPWFDAIRVLDAMPWREKRVRARLAELGTGELVVRTRGGAVDPDVAARRLRGRTGPRRTVAILRLGRDVVAFIGDIEA